MKIRPVRQSDARRIAEIHVRAWQTAYRDLMPDSVLEGLSVRDRADFWSERIERAETTVWVATDQGTVCGWLASGPGRDSDSSPSNAEVYGLYVEPAAWRKKVGTQLWAEASTSLTGAGVSTVTLWVLEANSRARGFYESIGFQLEVGQVKHIERAGAVLPEVRYRTELGPIRD